MENILEKQASPRLVSLITFVALLAFLPLLVAVVFQAQQYVSRASEVYIPAQIVVDARLTLEPITTDFYHAFAQGGEEANDMLASVIQETRALKPKLIRLDHLYDHYDIVGRSGTELTYDFSKLDKAIDTILSLGAKPVLALSFMPSVIAKDGKIINPPNDWNEWAAVTKRTIEHYSGKGERNISNIYYEVWNEPDLDQFGKWSIPNYLTLYRYAANGAGQAQNTQRFYLCGPVTTGLYKSWVISLIESGMRVDCLSWHSYLADPRQFAVDHQNLISWLLPYPSRVLMPFLISEYGFTGSKDKRYGTAYGAAFTAAAIRQLISGRPTYIFTFQLKDGPNQSAGDGWGLITHDDNGKKTKPRYHVFPFLDSMAGTRVKVSGEGSRVTGFATKRDNTLRIMLVNFDRYGNRPEQFPLTILGLESGSYAYRERFLFGKDLSVTETLSSFAPAIQKQIIIPAQTVAIIEVTKQ